MGFVFITFIKINPPYATPQLLNEGVLVFKCTLTKGVNKLKIVKSYLGSTFLKSLNLVGMVN